MASTSIGTLTVDLLMQTGGLEKGSEEATKRLARLEGTVGKVEKTIKRSMAAAGAAVTAYAATLGVLAKREIELIARQDRLARSIGATVTGIRAVDDAASDQGIEGLDKSLARLTRRLGAVEAGGGPAVKAVENLGLSIDQLATADADEKLALIADGIRESGISSQQAARHLQDLGFEQQGVINLFAQGGDALRDYRKEVEATGRAVSEIDAAKVELADRAMRNMGQSLDGLQTQLAVNLAPLIEAAAKQFEEWSRVGVDGTSALTRAIDGTIEATAKAVDVMAGFVRTVMVGFEGAKQAVRGLMLGIVTMIDATVNNAINMLNAMIERINSLPGVDIGLLDEFTALDMYAEMVAEDIEQGWKSMHETLMKPMPGDSLRKWVSDARDAGEEAAKALVESREKAIPEAANDSVFQEQIDDQIQALLDYGLAREELLEQQYERELDHLKEALEEKQITEDTYRLASQNAWQQYQDSLAEMERERLDAQFRGTQQFFGRISTLMNTESKALFKIGKAAAYAEAVVSGLQASVEAYKYGAKLGGPALGAAYAAAATAETGAKIAAISATKFGATAPATSNTAAINEATEPVGAPRQEVFLRGIDPDMLYDGRQILEALNDEIEDGGRIVGIGA